MKSIIKSGIFVLLLASVGLIVPAYSLCTSCDVSSNSDDNTGVCRSSLYGDICYSSGNGPSCSSTDAEPGNCDDEESPQIQGR